jgi:outer membrane lipoprotein-sorting protein
MCRLFPLIASLAALLSLTSAWTEAASEGPDPGVVLADMEVAYENVQDYTAVFLKRERVNGELLPEETIAFKFKRPFKVYMKWVEKPHKGLEALYAKGKYGDKVVGHEGGILGFITAHMDPKGSLAMKGNRHPITDVGIGKLIGIIMENYTKAVKEDAGNSTYMGDRIVFGKRAYDIKVNLLPEKDGGYYAKDIEVWVDKENGLPIKILIYGWQDELLESYVYKDLRLNPGLSDSEFEMNYEGYGF